MRRLAVDYGRARIGVAVSDAEGISVRGLPTIDLRGASDPIARLVTIAREQKAGEIVMGLPLSADDAETRMSLEVREFASRLHAATALPVVFIDEAFSSVTAHGLLRHRPRKQRQDKATVDRIAACLLLERYLSDLSNAPRE